MPKMRVVTFENGVQVAEEEVEVPEPQPDRLADLEDEVRGMKERAAAATVTGDAAKVRDAVTGNGS